MYFAVYLVKILASQEECAKRWSGFFQKNRKSEVSTSFRKTGEVKTRPLSVEQEKQKLDLFQ